MKKLMIGMLAAGAAIASAWAQSEAGATVQFSTEAFENAAPDFTVAPWSYTGDADAELTIKTGGGSTSEGKYLELNTASKKLSLAPTAIGKYAVTNEVYFDSWVKFDAASDTIPDVGTGDKLALFVLDDTDYIPETDTPSKALYVIGGYMNGGNLEKRLYKLSTYVDDKFLAAFNHISIKMYENVMASGTSVPGFLIKVGDTVAQVAAAYTTDANGVWVLGDNAKLTVTKGEYLGAAIDPAVAASRYNSDKGELILGLDKGDSELNAVDFMGKGGIDALAFGKTDVGFGEDASMFILDIPGNVVGVYADSEKKTSYSDGAEIPVAAGDSLKLWVELSGNYYLGGSQFVEVTVGAGDDLADKLVDAYEAILLADNVGYGSVGTEEGQGQFNPATSVETIKLLKKVELGAFRLQVKATCVLDLNGCEITSTSEQGTILALPGSLTIVDNTEAKNGKVTGKVAGNVTINAGTFDGEVSVTTINAGTFNGAVTGATIYGGTYNGTVSGASIPVTSTAAKFLASANTAANLVAMLTGQKEGFTYSFDGGNYLTIVETADSNNDVVVDGDISINDQATADANVAEIEEELVANNAGIDAKAWVEKIYGEKGVPAADLVRAQNIDISVKFDLPLMQNDPVITVEASTVEAPAEGQPENVAAFEFTITDGDAVGAAILTPATVEKVLSMVQYVDSLTGTWDGAGTDDVDTKISDNGKIKVQLKKKAGKNCGFMKLKLK